MLSIDSRSLARFSASPVALTPPPPTHPLAARSLRRLCCFLKFAYSPTVARMELSAPSGLPLFIATSAALMPWSAAFFSEASSFVVGQLLVTSITLGADTAPSESLTSTASSTFPSTSPPGR